MTLIISFSYKFATYNQNLAVFYRVGWKSSASKANNLKKFFRKLRLITILKGKSILEMQTLSRMAILEGANSLIGWP